MYIQTIDKVWNFQISISVKKVSKQVDEVNLVEKKGNPIDLYVWFIQCEIHIWMKIDHQTSYTYIFTNKKEMSFFHRMIWYVKSACSKWMKISFYIQKKGNSKCSNLHIQVDATNEVDKFTA